MINRNIRQRWDCSSLKRSFLLSLVQNFKQNLYLIQDFISIYFSSRWSRNRFCISQTYHRILSHVSIQFYYSCTFKMLPLHFLSFTFIPNTLMISLKQKNFTRLIPRLFYYVRFYCGAIVFTSHTESAFRPNGFPLRGKFTFHAVSGAKGF